LFDIATAEVACMELYHLFGGFFTGVVVEIESYFSIVI
jgi:hypothetical protein